MVLESNRVHYYCGLLLTYCTSPERWTMMIVDQLVEWMNGMGNRSTRRKPALVRLCPPHISHHLTRARNRAAAVGNRRLTAWGTAQHGKQNVGPIFPNCSIRYHNQNSWNSVFKWRKDPAITEFRARRGGGVDYHMCRGRRAHADVKATCWSATGTVTLKTRTTPWQPTQLEGPKSRPMWAHWSPECRERWRNASPREGMWSSAGTSRTLLPRNHHTLIRDLLSVCSCACLSTCLYHCSTDRISAHSSTCIFTCIPMCVHLSVYLSIYLSNHPFISNISVQYNLIYFTHLLKCII
jgi:hypothetical protein